MSTPGAAWMSTSSLRPASSSSGLARCNPLELPIFTNLARMAATQCVVTSKSRRDMGQAAKSGGAAVLRDSVGSLQIRDNQSTQSLPYPERVSAGIQHSHNDESFVINVVIDAERKTFRQGTIMTIYDLVNASEVGQRFNV